MRGDQATAPAPPPRTLAVTPFEQAAASWGLRVLASDDRHHAIFLPTGTDELSTFETPPPYRFTAFVRNRDDGSWVPHLAAVYGRTPRAVDESALPDFSGGLHFARIATEGQRPIMREVPCRDDYTTVLEWTSAWKQQLHFDEDVLSQMAHAAYLPSVRRIVAYPIEGTRDEGVIFVLETALHEGFADANVSSAIAPGREPDEGGAIETRQVRFAIALTRLRHLIRALEYALPTPAPERGERLTVPKAGASQIVEATASPPLFLSHSSADRSLVLAMVDCLEHCIPALRGRIVCTSRSGGSYPVGEDLADAVIRDIKSAQMVVGLLTDDSLSSEWPMIEMYNAVGCDKRLGFVLGPGMKLDRVPAPLKKKLTVSVEDRGSMPNLIDTVAKVLGLEIADKKKDQAMNRFYAFVGRDRPSR